MITIDLFSTTTIPITMYFNDTALSVGSAFMWASGGQRYLITNWHNLTGKNPITGRHLSLTGAEPNRIKALLHQKGRLGDRFEKFFSLLDDDNNPNWFVHPQLGKQIDAVALPISPVEEADWFHINNIATSDLQVKVGHDVFILGYPFGIGPSGYPIWKRASVAPEPEVFTLDQRYMLVDTASRSGMSGSQVLRRTWGTHMFDNGGTVTDGQIATRFVGIYSGRLSTTDALDAQLGLVWPAFYVEDIVNGQVRDSFLL